MLRGIDISSWQSDISVKDVDTDFAIIKATQGISYINPYMANQVQSAFDGGKLIGFYHFADGSPNAIAEADHFIQVVSQYIGKAILVLDWEDDALVQGPAYAEAFLDHVLDRTGVSPWIYMSKDVTRQYAWDSVASKYNLWYAQYASYDPMGWEYNPWTDSDGTGAWSYPAAFQYTSVGRIAGYSGDLDLNLFYGDREDWTLMAAGKSNPEKKTRRIDIANVAAQIHADMCNDERNGYSWRPRTGGDHPDGEKRLVIDGYEYSYSIGSWDCSSSIIKAWQEAIKYTKYAGALDGATYTGNMRNVFANSGLFEVWDTSRTVAQRGDVYLNDASHTAMCQSPNPDILSEFSMSENGDVYNNQVGDQTSWESHITGYYDYPWWCTLHYNHMADFNVYKEDFEMFKVSNIGGKVHRLYNTKSGHHHLTSDENEIESLLKTKVWKDEGVLFEAKKGGVVPIYRMYNPSNGDHLFTTDFKEADTIVRNNGWMCEGVPFFGSESGAPVYRLYNRQSGQHLFTKDKNEIDSLADGKGWVSEGIAWEF